MAVRKTDTLQQKVKVLAKLYDSGCKTEKDLKALSLQNILKIPCRLSQNHLANVLYTLSVPLSVCFVCRCIFVRLF